MNDGDDNRHKLADPIFALTCLLSHGYDALAGRDPASSHVPTSTPASRAMHGGLHVYLHQVHG